MSSRLRIASAALAAFLAAASAAWAQEVKEKPAPAPQEREPAEGEDLGILIGISYSLWVADLDFKSESTTQIIEFDVPAMSGVEIYGQMEVVPEWSVRLGGDFLFSADMKATVGSLGVVYTPFDLLEDPLTAHFRAGIVLGSITLQDVEGDFKPSVGVEAGAGVTYALDEYLEGLGFQIEAMFRYLKFDFDKDETVVNSDDEIGGFGARFTAGFVYRF